MSIVMCHCGIHVDTDHDHDALDCFGDVECRSCRQGRMDHMDAVINERILMQRDREIFNKRYGGNDGRDGII